MFMPFLLWELLCCPVLLTTLIIHGMVNVLTLPTLPHVIKYQTVLPRRLNGSSFISDSATTHQKYPDVLQYSVSIEGENYTLHLERNIDLIGENFSVTHYSDQGAQITTPLDLSDHCYYHGHVVEVDDSSVSVSLCSEVKGFVRLLDQMYLIEPLPDPETGQQSDSQSSSNKREQTLHAFYNYRHLRMKRSTCSQGNTTEMFYDFGALPSGLHKLTNLEARTQTSNKPMVVELVLVADFREYTIFGSVRRVQRRLMEVANHVDKLYRPLGIRVMLVGVEIWSIRDQITVSPDAESTLHRFLEWRQRSLLPRIKHDNIQLVTGVKFNGPVVGLANTKSMCTYYSGGVNYDSSVNPIAVASTVAHEMGHNLGMEHDTMSCVCGSSVSDTDCVMARSIGSVYPHLFSSCSREQLTRFLATINVHCLRNTPSTNRIFGGPVCGNNFLEIGEDCDCGTEWECQDPCCDTSTCKLKAGAECAEGECCHRCQLKSAGTLCRQKTGDCDLAEHCTGLSGFCPADDYAQNGLPCNGGRGYCHNGRCPSLGEQCKRLWGPDAEVAAGVCFSFLCGQSCHLRDVLCGKLYCSGGWDSNTAILRKVTYRIGRKECHEARLNPDDNYPEDMIWAPTGTKCGNSMVCYNRRCQDLRNLVWYGTTNCSNKCNNHGVCNHRNECHCDPGWAPPYCDTQYSNLPKDSTVAIIVFAVIGSILVLVLIGLSMMQCKGTRTPGKRWFEVNSGQSDPRFRPSSRRGRFGNKTISLPTFVTSSSTQACNPLSRATAGPHTGALRPNRAPPLPPQAVPPVSQPSEIQQAKPPPPSRPLPLLQTKPMKPKPPVLPVKPKPSVIHSPLANSELLTKRAALMSINRPR
ncbi:disintegrin and metalloproteinase domain-containing protein 8 isoform X2 [Cynoglossus semilaevis]|uniref:disintegrin and metalloproteinase domain-containing protein 8 isoform X2 n=1 Tax=Cynoglossus semilaevis TaxID=244447 RepID=UPI000D62B2ED|nr:disintegrin and metalloproteinase domain-containing protein 8 isoform X2 [Cynoglossus semilaevis]